MALAHALAAFGLMFAALPGPPEAGVREAPSIPVLAQVPAKTYYVGQAIELRIGAEGESHRPEVVPPVIPDAEVALIGTELSPVAATGIGDLTRERNLFITRFRLIARRAGRLRIPPVVVRLGSRSGA